MNRNPFKKGHEKKSDGWVQCPIAHSVECYVWGYSVECCVWGFWPFGLRHTLSSVVCEGFGHLALGIQVSLTR
jgi:hypothetical protein